jgi:hypothetical protein
MDTPFHLQLKTLREKKELTLEDVSHKTRIPTGRLILLEAGDYASFGSMAYARYFMKAYCDYLGMNTQSTEQELQHLPRPILGGDADYRHLTRSLGPWIIGLKGTNFEAQRHAVELAEVGSKKVALRAAALITLLSAACVAWAIYVGGAANAEASEKETAAPQSQSETATAKEMKGFVAAEQIKPALVAQ